MVRASRRSQKEPDHYVSSVQFGLMSKEDILRLSVVEVNTLDLYEGNTDRPKDGGLLDLRMGSVNKKYSCESCKQDFEECPGHFGHITLAKPVLHFSWIKEYLLPVLDCCCFHCGKLRLPKDSVEYRRISKLKPSNPNKKVRELKLACSKYNVCTELVQQNDPTTGQPIIVDLGCGQHQPIYEFVGATLKVRAIFPDKKSSLPPSGIDIQKSSSSTESDSNSYPKKKGRKKANPLADSGSKKYHGPESYFINLSPEQIEIMLRSIDEEDYEILGFDPVYARPSAMVITHLLVAPINLRPNNKACVKNSAEGWLTSVYTDILRINLDMKKESESQNLEARHQLLQTMVAFFFDSKGFPERARAPSNSLKRAGPNKSMVGEMSTKQGLVRGSINGKRGNYGLRTVIFQDGHLEQDQVGLPVSMAKVLIFRERVNDLNRSKMQTLTMNGAKKYPGVNFITLPSGHKIDMKACKDPSRFFPLPNGTIIERHLQNDDLILFNRQPSLHRLSLMAHRVRIYLHPKLYGVGIKETQCAPYNADFDGDEMNGTPAMEQIDRAEAHCLLKVTRNMTSPQSNAPVMGFIQDSLVGSRLLSLKDTFLTKDQFFSLVQTLKWTKRKFPAIPIPAVLKPQPLWTGKQLFSLLLPQSFNYKGESGHHVIIDENAKPEQFDRFVNDFVTFAIPNDDFIFKIVVSYHWNVSNDTLRSNNAKIVSDHIKSLISKIVISQIKDAKILQGFQGSVLNLSLPKEVTVQVTSIQCDYESKSLVRYIETEIEASFPLCINSTNEYQVHKHFDVDAKEITAIIPRADTQVRVYNGDLIMGNLCKRTVGAAGGSMIGYLFLFHGELVIKEFMDNWCRICFYYLTHIRGFTLGAKDFQPEPNMRQKILETVAIADDKIKSMKQDASLSYYQREARINTLMEQTRAKFTMNTNSLLQKRNDNFYTMLGIKGTNLNPPQMLVCLGQIQVKKRQRIENGYPGRTLPHFKRGDDSALAKGFIASHFMDGMNPIEFFFHAISARESSVETTMKTSETGYIQRRLQRFLEELCCQYDGSVRDSQGNLYDFCYGEDGFDNMRLLKTGFLPHSQMPFDKYLDKFCWNLENIRDPSNQIRLKASTPYPVLDYQLEIDQDSQRVTLFNERNRIEKDRILVAEFSTYVEMYCSPWNFAFLLAELKPISVQDKGLTPWQIAEDVLVLQKKLLHDHPFFSEAFQSTFFVELRHELYSKKILQDHNPTKQSWTAFLHQLYCLWCAAIINPGEMVGLVAAQSVGEPATQMTLNTFQYQGNAEKNIQLGVPRLKELIDASKNNQTPFFSIRLKPQYQSDDAMVDKIARRMVQVYLKDIAICSIHKVSDLPLADDREWFDDFAALPDDCPTKDSIFDDPDQYIDLVLRVELKPTAIKDILLPAHMTMSELLYGMRKRYSGIYIVSSDIYSDPACFYLYIKKNPSNKKKSKRKSDGVTKTETEVIPEDEQMKWAIDMEQLLMDNHLVFGIPGIKRASVKRDKQNNVVIETEGQGKNSFNQILNLPWVDASKSQSNFMHDVHKKFGIEAARSVIIKELQLILKSYGFSINPRHLCLAVNLMTWTGGIEGFTRSGIGSRSSRGLPTPLKQASFEKTWPSIQLASRFAQKDSLLGITESIMFGREARFGTNMASLLPQLPEWKPKTKQ